MNVPREAVGEDLVLAGFKLPDVSSSPRNPALSGSLSVTRSSGALQRCLLIVFASCFLEPLICFVFTSLSLIWFTCSFFLRLSSAICSLALIIVKYTSFQGEGRGGGPEYPKLQTFADGTDLTPVEAKFISLFFFICNWRSFFERTKNFFVRDFIPSTLRTQTPPGLLRWLPCLSANYQSLQLLWQANVTPGFWKSWSWRRTWHRTIRRLDVHYFHACGDFWRVSRLLQSHFVSFLMCFN